MDDDWPLWGSLACVAAAFVISILLRLYRGED